MVEVSRREKESAGSLLRRFTRKAQQAGLLIEARKGRYFKKTLSPFKKKKAALRRVELRVLHKSLVKKGLIEESSPVPQQMRKKTR